MKAEAKRSESPRVDSMTILRQVAQRLQMASFASRCYGLMLAVGGVYALLLLLSRFTGIPEGLEFQPLSLLLVPVIALVLAAIWHPKPTTAEAARCVDQDQGTKDLFLTYATLDNSAGDYQALVLSDAERKARRVDPQRVVTWNWQARAGRLGAMLALLGLAVMYLPQFDPFGKVAKAEEAKEKEVVLANDKKATELRKAAIKKQGEESKATEEIESSINDLTKTLGQMKREKPDENRRQLQENQKDLAAKFRKFGAEKLRTLLSQDGLLQDFGGDRQKKLKQWTEDLLQREGEAIKEEMKAIQDQLQEFLNEQDPVKKAEMARDMKEQLRDLAEFAKENAGSPELNAALRRAMRQMEAAEQAGDPEKAKEAMEALKESLELSQMELEQISDAVKDMKKIEEALKTLQQAKSLNEKGELDGEGTEGFESLEDYKELYAEMMGNGQGNGQGNGEGTGGEGIGEGGEVPEDDSVASDFKKEQDKAATRAGKFLMSLKVQGDGEAGEANKEYRQAMSDIKQQVSEAISQEQVPPGYHQGIRGYFDSIDQDVDEQPEVQP